MRVIGRILRSLAWIFGIFFVWQVILRVVRKVRPFPIPADVGALILDSPVRERWISTDEVVRRIGVEPGQTVLEVGSGTGHVAIPVARAVGDEGKVYAVDVEPKMVERLRQRALTENVPNLEVKFGDATKLLFADETFDVVYMVTALGELPDKRAALAEANRVLKPGGTLSVTEILPDPDYMLKGTVIANCEDAGFFLIEEHGGFFTYTVNFRKPSRRAAAGA